MSAPESFGRRATLVVNNAIISANVDKRGAVGQVSLLRFAFKIVRTLTPDPNVAEIVLYNLSAQSRAALQEKNVEIALEAGYESNTEIIFQGQASKIEHRHEGPDWITKISCGDGEKAIREAQVSQGFGPNTKFSDVVKACSDALGLSEGNLTSQLSKLTKDGQAQFSNGAVIDGQASKVLDKLMKSIGVSWSVQGGKLQILKDDEAVNDPALLIDSSQLIGKPESGEKSDKAKEKGPVFKGKVLLEPGVRPGRRLTLRSEATKGSFRVERAEHSGDTWGQDWYSTFEAKPVQT